MPRRSSSDPGAALNSAGVDFFERQRTARGTSAKLVVLFVLAVLASVAVIDVIAVLAMQGRGNVTGVLVVVSAGTLLVIVGGMIGKSFALRKGGSAVAASVGAVPVDPTTTDPALRRFVNVVEEMSIASGVPMPRLFVLPRERGINAFAAGYTAADAAITVTEGALSQLSRDELQGVIGHEFSHVLNGDMRLSIRLIGLLYGIMLLGLVGSRVLALGGRGSDRKGALPIVAIAFGAMVVGFVGQFFAGLIKAAVSRQREWLADASAVQFTRQPDGLAGALKKIAGLPEGSRLADERSAKEVSHMLFGEGRRFSRLFSTHPPIHERIAALDPTFREADLETLRERWRDEPPPGPAGDVTHGLAPAVTAPVAVTPEQVSARAGTLTPADLDRGAALHSQVPPHIHQLATQPSTAASVVLAMVVCGEPALRATQLAAVQERLGIATARSVDALVAEVAALPRHLRLPVVGIASPQLTGRPDHEQQALVAALDDLALADGAVSLFEYCLTRTVRATLQDAADPASRSRPGSTAVRQATDEIVAVLTALALSGNADRVAAERAFAAAFAHLRSGAPVPEMPASPAWRRLDACWPVLDGLARLEKRLLVEAMVVAVLDDGKLTSSEAELLRAACALVHVPLPALIA
jgi:Zn-dependent protease with chaperone function